MDILEFFEPNMVSQRRRIPENKIVFHYNTTIGTQSYSITLNSFLSSFLVEKGFLVMSMATNKVTGELFFIFSRGGENGIPVRINKNSKCLSVNGKRLTEWIAEKLGADANALNKKMICHSENKSQNGDYITLKITL